MNNNNKNINNKLIFLKPSILLINILQDEIISTSETYQFLYDNEDDAIKNGKTWNW